MNGTKLSIKNNKRQSLHAYLELPASQKPNYYALFAHCFTCHSDQKAVKNICRSLTGYGVAVVRFDFTGLGKSEGEFSESHFSANLSDILTVQEYMKDNYEAASLLIGHSLGGAAVLVAASHLKSVRAVVTIGAPASIEHVKKHFSHKLEEVKTKGEVEVNIGGRPFKINQEFVEDFEKTDLLKIVRGLKKPLMIMHSPFDKIVGVENAREIYDQAFHPKSFISLDDADHLLTKSKDSLYAGNMIGTWSQRYLPQKDNHLLDTKGEQLVAYLNPDENGFTTSMQTKKHALIADEPVEAGGDDFGPSPYDYLCASLAACTVMTLKLYAERKGWNLKEVYAYITYSKKHSDDLNVQVETPGHLDFLSKKLKLVGNLDEGQRLKLKEIAAKCPVQKTMLTDTVIDTDLLD